MFKIGPRENGGPSVQQMGITEQTYYEWRKEYDGLKMD